MNVCAISTGNVLPSCSKIGAKDAHHAGSRGVKSTFIACINHKKDLSDFEAS